MDRHRDRQRDRNNSRTPRPRWRGDGLRALRKWAGHILRGDGRDLSQFQLAEEIKASERAVRAWEADDRILIQPALIDNLDAFAERIGFFRNGGEDDMKRSTLLAGGAALVVSQLLPAPARAIDERYVTGLAEETTALESRYDTRHVVQLMDSAISHYQRCVSLLDHTSTHIAHRQLQVVAGATALLIGILAREAGLWAWSRQYTGAALDLAQEAGHGGLEARASSDLGFLYSPRLGDGAHADVRRYVAQAEHAHSLAQRFSPPAMRSFASLELGVAYAADGQRAQARGALSQAGSLLSGDGAADDLGARFVGTMDETRIMLSTGRGLLALGDVRPAIRYLEDGLRRDLPPLAAVNATIALAEGYARGGDRQREASMLARARAVSTRHGYVLGVQRIEALAAHPPS
ncbi:MAG: hypothetical protein ACRD0K_02605 [Egibacteraceae bacterium]